MLPCTGGAEGGVRGGAALLCRQRLAVQRAAVCVPAVRADARVWLQVSLVARIAIAPDGPTLKAQP